MSRSIWRYSHVLLACTALSVLTIPAPVEAQEGSLGGPGGRQNPEEMVEKGISEIETGNLDEAGRLYQQVATLKPTLSKLKLLEGLLHAKSTPSRGPQAMFAFEQYNQTDEGKVDYRGFSALSEVYLESRLYRQALEPLRNAKKLAPPPLAEKDRKVRSKITITLATTYRSLKNHKKALEAAQEAQRDSPNDGEIQVRLGEIAAAANEFEVATGAVERASLLLRAKIRDEPFNESAHDLLKQCYSVANSLHQYDIKNNDPDNGEQLYAYAKMFRGVAELERRLGLLNALEVIEQALEKDGKNSAWRLMKARLQLDLGGIADAKETLDIILQADPDNQQAQQLKQELDTSPKRHNLP